ncbi:MAG: TolC family protein [Parachlamydiaceae bacterium]|nr:TolC family protein [Parachlamydiaceae bacterium]
MDVNELRDENMVADLELLEYIQEPVIEEPLTLPEILEIAFAYNLDIYAQQYEREVQARISNAQHLQMLPALTADAFYNYRSKDTSAFTKLVGAPKPAIQPKQFPQISSLKTTFQDDLRCTINFIDMGLAYFRAKQEKDRTLIIEQQQLRARQKLVLDITEQYWKAVGAKRTLNDMLEIIRLSESYQKALAHQIEERSISQLQGLQVASRLVDQQSQFESLRYLYESSKIQLGGLMGILPGTYFELADVDNDLKEIEIYNIREVEEEALRMRPELYVKDLEERISIDKVKESIIPMLPNASLFEDTNYDQNPFIVHHYWWSIGMRATWNLFLIPQKMQEKRAAEAQKEFSKASRLALAVGIMSQVHLAYMNYRDALNQYQIALRSLEIRDRLAVISQKIQGTGEFTGIDVLNFDSDALLGRINVMRLYASLKIAEEQLNFAIGRPFNFPDPCDKPDVELSNQEVTPASNEF